MIVAHGVYRVNEKIKTGRNSHVPVFHMQSLLVGVVSGIETRILFLIIIQKGTHKITPDHHPIQYMHSDKTARSRALKP